MDIVFVRHGRTRINQEGRYGGFLDTEISKEGIDEIKWLRKYLSGIEFDFVYASPLKRAAMSVEILYDRWIIDDRLREMNFGIFEGLSHSEAAIRYPNEMELWGKDYVNYRLTKGESLKDVYDRTVSFIGSIERNAKKVLVVTHGGIIGCALSSIFKGPEDFFRFRINHGTSAIISLNEGFGYIKGINCTEGIAEILGDRR